MVEATGNGISLFSHPSRKRRKLESSEKERSEQAKLSRKASRANATGQASTAVHQGTAQSEELTDLKELDHRTDVHPNDPDSRSGDVSTSGRTANDERAVTSRSLGVSEWLDR